jgi:Cu+-exporting ATPase
MTSLSLPIEGMTCASCAVRIEKRLNKLEGVTASVNYATECAAIEFDPGAASEADLVKAVEAAGYRARPEAQAASEPNANIPLVERPWWRLAGSAVLGIPVILMAMIPALQFDYWQWLCLQLATPVVFWGGWPFHRAALQNLRHGAATMDTLISVGTLAAWAWSVAALFFLSAGDPAMRMKFDLALGAKGAELYLEISVAVVLFILLGRYFETRAKSRAGEALRAVLELGAKEARILRHGVEVEVPIEEVRVDDRFVVRPGEKIATDGEIEAGTSAVDQSMLTGESVPVEVAPGSQVAGGTINTYGLLTVRATRIGADTALAQIAKLVTEAQNGKAEVQRLADRVAGVFVPIVIAIALATFCFWVGASATTQYAFTAAIAVLIIACPCALGLATPTALLVGTGRGAQLGILIKGPQILEQTKRIGTIVLDKTGTVTEGRVQLAEVALLDGLPRSEVLRLAASVEAGSEHPIAKAIVDAANNEDLLVQPVHEFRNIPGVGVQGLVTGRRVEVGRSNGAITVSIDGAAAATLTVRDSIKPTSPAAIAELKRLGLTPVLLTGDNEETARRVAAEVGIERVIADVMPDEKAAEIKRLQAQGEVVAMVGDGVNDAPALAQADLGLAIGTGTDVAIEASDLTLVSGDLRAAGDAIRLARRTLATIKGNLFWAFAYNVAAIPLASTGQLNPILAAGAMAFSSVFVVSNSLRLRAFKARE